MQDSEFNVKVGIILDNIVQDIEDQDTECEIDIDLNDGILTLFTNSGTFVINKQSAVKEIWLSSPISGPYHFAYLDNLWKSRNGSELFTVLTNELNIEFSKRV